MSIYVYPFFAYDPSNVVIKCMTKKRHGGRFDREPYCLQWTETSLEFTNYKSPQASLSALHSLKPKCFLVGWYRQHIRWYGYICNRPISAKRYIGQALILSTWVQYMAFCLCFLFFFQKFNLPVAILLLLIDCYVFFLHFGNPIQKICTDCLIWFLD